MPNWLYTWPTFAYLGMFWAFQLIANVLFKYGSMAPGRERIGFILGNVFGASSIFFMMQMYKRMNVNVAMTIGGAGTTLLVQAAMVLLFHSRPTFMQWVGIATVMVGGLIFSFNQPVAGK